MSHKILIIEDEPLTQKLISAFFKDKGFELFIFENGQAAISHLEKNSSEPAPLAIFSDFMLPDGDGVDFLNSIRQIYSKDQLPFYFVTGVEKDMIESFVDASLYNHIISKPVHKEIFDEIIQSLNQGA